MGLIYLNNLSYQDIIARDGFYIATPIGNSMWPMLRSRVDTVKLVFPNKKLKKGNIILYKKNNQYILHRIIKVCANEYVLCGDGNWQKEYHITNHDIIAVGNGFYRKDKYISCNNIIYRIYVIVWMTTRPLRKLFHYLTIVFSNKKKKQKNNDIAG